MPFVHNQTYPVNYSTMSPTGEWTTAAYGNGTFVIAGAGDPYETAYSTNGGQTWTAGSGLTFAASKIAYGNGKFVAVGSGNPSKIAYSSDGITWTNSTSFTYDYNWTGVAYGNGIWVAVSKIKTGSLSSNTFATSTDGVTWEMRNTLPVTSTWATVSYGPAGFIAVSNSPSPNSTQVIRSTDGITWADLGTINRSGIGDSVYGDGYYVILNGTGSIAYSTDGVAWTINNNISPISSTPGSTASIAYGNGVFVVSGGAGATNPPRGNSILFSSTLSGKWNLTNIPSRNTYSWSALAYGTAPTAGWICCGYFYDPLPDTVNSTSATSANGQNWF